jgi:hypothetical protein
LPNQSARFEIANDDKLKGGFAPHAILAYADDGDSAFVNIGYALQGADLWLQSNGYGSVWCGMAKPLEPSPNYRILLGFGKTDAPLRKSETDFKRKKISEISNEDNSIAQAVRLAPSAVNFQPWKLSFTDKDFTITANVRGVGKILPGRLFLYDLGIALKHAELALENEGKSVKRFELSGNAKTFAVKVACE